MCVFFLLRPKAREGEAPLGAGTGPEPKKKHHPGCCFFFAPATGKGRGRRSPVGRRHGARAKKRTPPMVICFFCCGPGEWQGKEKPRWAPARGQSKKKTPPRVCVCFFFFCCGPGERQGKEKPRWAPARGQSKKRKTPRVFLFFFAAAPTKGRGRWTPRPFGGARTHCGLGRFRQGRMVLFFCCGPAGSFLVSLKRLGGAAAKKKHHGRCFFLLRPRADAHSLTAGLGGASPSPFAAAPPGPGWCFFFCCGPAQTLTHSLWAGAISARFGWCFFFCCGPAGSFLVSLKRPGGAAAKKTPRGGVFFFAAAPRGRSLTHCGPGWCLPLAGMVFFFLLLRPRPDRGGVFFLLWPRPDAHSLTVGWGDFGKVRVVFFFFAVAPPGLFWLV